MTSGDRRLRVSRVAPVRATKESLPEVEARALRTLRDEFGVPHLVSLPDFIVIVEGTTDRGYLSRTADLLKLATGADPRDVPVSLRRGALDRISVVVPGMPAKPVSGGVQRMVDLARALSTDFFSAGIPAGVVFLFDHDWAGRQARDKIKQYGFRPDRHSLTLDPSEHAALADWKEVVVEDLLPLELQHAFFQRGSATCSLHYKSGTLQRIKWELPSKGELRHHVSATATLEDLREFVRLWGRIRALLGFPELLQDAERASDGTDPSSH